MSQSKQLPQLVAVGVLLAAPITQAQTVPVAVIQSPPVVSWVASGHDGKWVMTVDVSRVAFSHNGKWAATIDPFRGNTTLWDAKTGTKVVALSHANAVIEEPNKSAPNESLVVYSFQPKGDYSLVFSPDDRYVAAFDARNANSDAPVVWDCETGEVMRPWKLDASNQLRLSNTNLTPSEVRIWHNGDRGTLPGSFATPQDKEREISKIAISADGEKLAVARGYLGQKDRNDLIEIWSLRGGKPPYTFATDLHFLESLAFSHDSQWLGAASQTGDTEDKYTNILVGEVRLWHFADGVETKLKFENTLAIPDEGWSATSVAFSPDNKQLVADIFTPRDVPHGQDLENMSYDVRTTFFDVASGHTVNSTPLARSSAVNRARFFWLSPDGRRAIALEEKKFIPFNTLTGHRLSSFKTSRLSSNSHSFDPCEHELPFSGFATFSADVRQIAISDGQQLEMLDAKTGASTAGNAPVVVDEPNKEWRTLAATFSPSGATLAVAVCAPALSSGKLRLYNVANLQEFAASPTDSTLTSSLAFTPDGTLLFTGGYDGAVRVWETQHGSPVATLVRSMRGEWIVFTPDGLYDASANGASLLAWRLKGQIVVASELPDMRLPGLLPKLVSGERPKPTKPLTSAISSVLTHSDR
jgi:WD40 repeat protein